MAAGRPFEGIFTIFENIVAAIGEKTGALVMRIGEELGAVGGSENKLPSGGGLGESVGNWLFGGNNNAVAISAPQQQPEVQITASAKQTCKFHVSEEMLGGLSPSVGGGARQDSGMSMYS